MQIISGYTDDDSTVFTFLFSTSYCLLYPVSLSFVSLDIN